jgi:carbon storage regulator
MLVISRKEGQRIVISDEIIVSVISVKGNRIQIGIEAPRSIPIHRSELLTESVPNGTSNRLQART